MTEKPDSINFSNIQTSGPMVSIGYGTKIHANHSNVHTAAQVDTAALKASLWELFRVLSRADLPTPAYMDVVTATGLATQKAKGDSPNVEELAGYLQQVGQALQKAQVVVEKVPQLAAVVTKIAQVLGPVVGGTKVVAGWFGLPLL
jgi:hypothetical protein